MRRFLLWALEFVVGDRYVRVSLLRDAAETTGPIYRAGSAENALRVIDDAILWARSHERGA